MISVYIFLNFILKALGTIVPLLVSVAFLTLLERKVMASMQQRRGPNVVGFFGLLQPFADGLKLLIKETILPNIKMLGKIIDPLFIKENYFLVEITTPKRKFISEIYCGNLCKINIILCDEVDIATKT
jgi:hypothetical protein